MSELDHACRAMLVVVLATAATGKLGGARPFAELARALRELGIPATPAIAATLIAAEALSAGLLIVAPIAGYCLAAALLVGFTMGIMAALARGRRVACRCFGATSTPISRAHVVRNAILIAGALAGAAGRWATTAGSVPEAAWLCVVIGVLVGAAITRWDDLKWAIS